jgi:hypothetical protein
MSHAPLPPRSLPQGVGLAEADLSCDHTSSGQSQPRPRPDTRRCVVCGSSLAGHRSYSVAERYAARRKRTHED